ncbi:MAG: hypothetical protein WCT24_01540 [Patescibacteria group bacterium]
MNESFSVQTNPEGGLKNRRFVAYGIVVAVLVAVIGFVVFMQVSDSPKWQYRGLTLTQEIQMDDAMRTLLEGRLATEKAALASQIKAAGGSNEDPDQVDWFLYEQIASDYYMLGDLVGAREAYEDYFKLNAINYVAWNNYANVLELMGDRENAEYAFKQAFTIEPMEEFYRDYIEYIKLDNEDGARDEEILNTLLDGVSRAGQTSWFMVELAVYYLAHGDCQNALDHYDVAKSLDPENETLVGDIAAARAQCATP